MRDFKRLDIWKRAHALALQVHGASSRLRGSQLASLRAQLTRAADSVPATIVEGCGASSPREFARYLDMSIKSASETEYHLLSARDRHALAAAAWRELTDEVVAIRRMTYAYRKKIVDEET